MDKEGIKVDGIVEGGVYPSCNCGDFMVNSVFRREDRKLAANITFIATGTNVDSYLGNIKTGHIKDKNYKSVHGVGYLGESKFSDNTKAYNTWSGMLSRCYDPKNLRYYCYGAVGVTVEKEWHCFHNFLKWWNENYIEGYNLDKDLLSKGGTKLYSKDNCCFIPKGVNSAISNITEGNGVSKVGNKWSYGSNRGDSKVKRFDTEEGALLYRADWFRSKLGIFLNEEAHKLPDKVSDSVVEMYNCQIERSSSGI